MRKEIKYNLKRIIALVITASMLMSMNVSALADDLLSGTSCEHALDGKHDNGDGTHSGKFSKDGCDYVDTENKEEHTFENGVCSVCGAAQPEGSTNVSGTDGSGTGTSGNTNSSGTTEGGSGQTKTYTDNNGSTHKVTWTGENGENKEKDEEHTFVSGVCSACGAKETAATTDESNEQAKTYTDNKDGSTHKVSWTDENGENKEKDEERTYVSGVCSACGAKETAATTEGNSEQTKTYTDNNNGSTHKASWTDENGENKEKDEEHIYNDNGVCVCGATNENHTHSLSYTINDNESHSVKCTVEGCGYKKENEEHTFVSGVCSGCDFTEAEFATQMASMYGFSRMTSGESGAGTNTDGFSYKTVDEVIDGVTHHVTYQDQGDGSHQAIACQVCTNNSKAPKDIHCAPGSTVVPHYFDENRTCVGCGLTVAEDELDEELKDVDLKSDYDTRLREYLALKYSDYNTDPKTNVRGKQYLGTVELNSIPSNIEIEIGNDTDAGLKELTKYMVNFNCLAHLENVKTIKIYGADIRFLYLPKKIETLVIQNSTFNLYRDKGIFTESENDASYAGTGSCTSLKNATLNNVTIGNHYKGTDRYMDNYYYHILNSTNLESFNINVNFTEPGQRFIIDAGATPFNSMSSCTISNGTEGTGSIIIKSSNSDSYFAHNFSQYIIEEADLESHFRTYLAYFTDIDSNHDKIVTQAELDAVTNLHIEYKEALMSYMDAMNDLRDIAKFRHLQTLTIDADVRRTGFHIDNIAFPTKVSSDPNTGKLESITINNLYTNFSTTAIAIPDSVKKFEYTDNYSIDNNGATFTISDNGSLNEVTLDRSNVKSVVINNATDSIRSLSLSAMECNKLEYIQLGGKGYNLSGKVALNDCGSLTKIGTPNTNQTEWTVNLANGAVLDIGNCTNFGYLGDDISSEIKINSNMQAIGVMAYGVNRLNDTHNLLINNSANSQTNVSLYYGASDTWWSAYATKIGTTGNQGSSTPSVALFPSGNHLRSTAKAGDYIYDRWVDRYEVEVLRISEAQGGWISSAS